MDKLSEFKLKRIQQYAVDVTGPCAVAHPNHIMSEDWNKVRDEDIKQDQPTQRPRDNPETDLIILTVSWESRVSPQGFAPLL